MRIPLARWLPSGFPRKRPLDELVPLSSIKCTLDGYSQKKKEYNAQVTAEGKSQSFLKGKSSASMGFIIFCFI
ncbi:hypothetical protein JTE90_016704 [Oedothorax gibbosus]|uniref:Uncharacterized protein n=1 Tax=Oedothorax gibbosus TaxID=931172 RepID=A0AAV6V3L9_9ARAC|nr:hypothetical protein JTE90_016704 [Oedothorax gibbosus]